MKETEGPRGEASLKWSRKWSRKWSQSVRFRSPLHCQRVVLNHRVKLLHEAREDEGVVHGGREGDMIRHPLRHELAEELQHVRPALPPERSGRLRKCHLSRRCSRRL